MNPIVLMYINTETQKNTKSLNIWLQQKCKKYLKDELHGTQVYAIGGFDIFLSLSCDFRVSSGFDRPVNFKSDQQLSIKMITKRQTHNQTRPEFASDGVCLPLHLIGHIRTLWKCIEMRTYMPLYLSCACDAIRTPFLSIICGVSVPHSERLQWGYFSQPSIQTWPITARLQKHFLCTQELTAVNGGYFQSLCCQSKCQVNTGQWK